jgi:hypothetical protein
MKGFQIPDRRIGFQAVTAEVSLEFPEFAHR